MISCHIYLTYWFAISIFLNLNFGIQHMPIIEIHSPYNSGKTLYVISETHVTDFGLIRFMLPSQSETPSSTSLLNPRFSHHSKNLHT